MNNADFWASVRSIIAEGFTPEGLLKLDSYAEQFISGRLVYQRFSPQEQHGCAAGGSTNVIASLLAGAEAGSDSLDSSSLTDYQRECQLGAQQESVIERWAKTVGVWTDCVDEQLPKTLGECTTFLSPCAIDLERQLGRTVISSERASDYIKTIESKDAEAQPLPEEE